MPDQATAGCDGGKICVSGRPPKDSPWRDGQRPDASVRLALYSASSPSLRRAMGLWKSTRAQAARENRRNDLQRVFTDRKSGVGSSRWDFHTRQMPPDDAPSNHRGIRPALQPRSPGRPRSRAARRKSDHKSWQLHCQRQRRPPHQQRRRHRQHSPNNGLQQAAPPIRKLPSMWQRQMRARSCSWSSPA